MPFSGLPDLEEDAAQLALVAARHCWMPHPETVASFGKAVFPTIRDQKYRGSVDHERGLLLDDNVSPRWALLWAHGYSQTHHPKGWTFAHVWALPKDPNAYTHLANLVMMPEALASLSDKVGPLGAYLRYHARYVYGWLPSTSDAEKMPDHYSEIEWKYFEPIDDPLGFVKDRVMSLNNKRVLILRELMGFE